MEREVVRAPRWSPPDEFLDLPGLTNLIPGPNSSEMAMALGYRRAGWAGLLAGGASFILPAAWITAASRGCTCATERCPTSRPGCRDWGPRWSRRWPWQSRAWGRPALGDAGLG